jgi:uracil-DNA glycosylase
VFGVGREDADIMFIGEAPGRNEDLKGEPFVGAAGKLLDELLASIGMHRSDVYIANILKCRPPGNRDPQQVGDRDVHSVPAGAGPPRRPRVIVTLGNFATRFVLKTGGYHGPAGLGPSCGPLRRASDLPPRRRSLRHHQARRAVR